MWCTNFSAFLTISSLQQLLAAHKCQKETHKSLPFSTCSWSTLLGSQVQEWSHDNQVTHFCCVGGKMHLNSPWNTYMWKPLLQCKSIRMFVITSWNSQEKIFSSSPKIPKCGHHNTPAKEAPLLTPSGVEWCWHWQQRCGSHDCTRARGRSVFQKLIRGHYGTLEGAGSPWGSASLSALQNCSVMQSQPACVFHLFRCHSNTHTTKLPERPKRRQLGVTWEGQRGVKAYDIPGLGNMWLAVACRVVTGSLWPFATQSSHCH